MPTFLATLLLAGCGTPKIGGFKQEDLRRWYVPGEGTSRPSVAYERVAYLDAPPTDRKYRVIGYVAPPSRRFHSPGELLNAIRAAASLYGGDAVFVDNQKELEGWGFSFNNFGGSGGKWRDVQVRAKVIAWEP